MLKSHQRRNFTPAETKVDYLPFAKVLYRERRELKWEQVNLPSRLNNSQELSGTLLCMKCLRCQIHDPLFQSLSSAIKEASFGKPLLIYLKTLWQVAKMDHAQGQMQCSNICTCFPCQNFFPSYFLSLWQVLSFFSAFFTVSECTVSIKGTHWDRLVVYWFAVSIKQGNDAAKAR